MNRASGFTWIELMMVVAVIAILALMAIPSLQEGTLRKQVKEGMALADLAKGGVQAAWSITGEMPADNKTAGIPDAAKIVGNMVSAVTVENGAITVTYGNNASKALEGKHLTLRPAVVVDQRVVPIAWICHNVPVPKGMELRGKDATDIAPPMLPVECRGPAPA